MPGVSSLQKRGDLVGRPAPCRFGPASQMVVLWAHEILHHRIPPANTKMQWLQPWVQSGEFVHRSTVSRGSKSRLGLGLLPHQPAVARFGGCNISKWVGTAMRCCFRRFHVGPRVFLSEPLGLWVTASSIKQVAIPRARTQRLRHDTKGQSAHGRTGQNPFACMFCRGQPTGQHPWPRRNCQWRSLHQA